MSIVPLLKVTLYGPAAEKDAVLDGLQRLGCLHLNDLHRGDAEAVDLTPRRSDAREALQYLHDSPVRRRALRHGEKVDYEAVVREVLEVRDRSRALAEEREQLHKWIADLEPWGDFELPDWAQEGDLRFWFYIVPLYQMERMAAVDLPWRVVARDHRFAYVVVMASDQPTGMPVPPVPLEPRSLSKLRQRLEQVERDLEELDYRRIGLTLYTDVLRETLDEADDRAARQQAARRVLEEDHLFAVQGWAPEARAAALRQFGADYGLAVTIEPPGPQDKPPTLLANPPALRGGEDLVSFYMTPAYRMWDPSKVVLFAFALFFAMILADAGYGVLLGVILWAMWKRLGATASGRGLRGVMLTLVIFSIVYGVLLGSYFGVEPAEGSWLGALHILHANDQGMMMWLSIGVGAVHLAGANLVTAWRRRHALHALSALGWAAIILGGLCVGLGKSYAPGGAEHARVDRPGARWSAGAALSQRAPVQSGAKAALGPSCGWTERIAGAFQGLWGCPELPAVVRPGVGCGQTGGGLQPPGCGLLRGQRRGCAAGRADPARWPYHQLRHGDHGRSGAFPAPQPDRVLQLESSRRRSAL